MKKILITGANSYIGASFENHLKKWPDRYEVDTIDMRDESWKDKDFSVYDTIYHVAGIAHSDSGRISPEKAAFYYKINTELAINTAKKAKAEGVKQFIFMSTASVYGNSAHIGKKRIITANTPASPVDYYGDSKLRAEHGLMQLQDEGFKVVILRPPMVYGRDCKGNYTTLTMLAQKLPIFPAVQNQRSMLYIGNMVEFVRLMVDNEEQGMFWPQNKEYSSTPELVKLIATAHGKKIALLPGFGCLLRFLSYFIKLVDKAFGNLCYDQELSAYKQEYCLHDLEESIQITEGVLPERNHLENRKNSMRILVFSQYFYPESFRINILCRELVRRGHEVTVVTGYPQYPIGRIYDGYGFDEPYDEYWEGVRIHRVKVIPRGNNLIGMLRNMLSYVTEANRWVKKCEERFDAVYVFEVSPVTVGLPAVKYKEKFGVPMYFNLQDLWPENVEEVLGIKFLPVSFVINCIVNKIYAACDKILCASNGFVDNLRNRGVPAEKLLYWPQFCEEPKLSQMQRPEILTEDTLNILFAGNLGDAQGLDLLVEAAKRLKGNGIRWYLVGDGRARQRLEGLVQKYGLEDDVIFVGRVSVEEADRYVYFADFAYLSFQNNKIFNMTIPAKLQTYLACGTPIIAAAGGESAHLITENGCGLVSVAELDALVETIKLAKATSDEEMQRMSKAAQICYQKQFTMEKLVDQLEQILTEHI